MNTEAQLETKKENVKKSATTLKSNKNSAIELLKIIAIFMIIISHSMPRIEYVGNTTIGIPIDVASNNIQNIIIILFVYLGQIGNAIFIVCSSYFLIDKEKCNIKRIRNIIIDTVAISILYLIVCKLLKAPMSIIDIKKQCFPILNNNNWFIPCYLLFYIMHPFLNIIIRNINKKQLLQINIFTITLYGIIRFIKANAYYYNDLIGFIVIYFIVVYMKLYLKNISKSKETNRTILTISIAVIICLMLVTNLLGLHSEFFRTKVELWNNFINPFMILIALSALNLFKEHNYQNKFINYISQLSLLIYLISENLMFKKVGFKMLYEMIYYSFTYNHICIYILIVAIMTFVVTALLAAIYKETLGRLLKVVGDKVFKYLEKLQSHITNTLLKLN